jgi:hypothetical protein
MPDLDLILQVEQGDADVRLPRQVNLGLLHNSGVPTAPRSRRVDRDEDRIGSLDRRHAFSRKSQPSRCRIGRHQTPEVWLVDRHLAAPQPRNLDA